MATTRNRRDIYQEVTDTVIAALEQGVVPWSCPWDRRSNHSLLPSNATTGRPYNGINVLLLWVTAHLRGYPDSRWLTFKQAQAAGGQVRKGEKGTLCTFWRTYEATNDAGELEKRFVLRHFNVFNIAQVDGLEDEAEAAEPVDPVDGFEACADVLQASGATVHHGGDRACYLPTADVIHMPPASAFRSVRDYWSTLGHELVHWTGHTSRLDSLGASDEAAYAFEELVAEMGSAFLNAQLGVGLEGMQHPSYIDHYLQVLRSDKRALMRAATAARKASEFLLQATAEVQAV